MRNAPWLLLFTVLPWNSAAAQAPILSSAGATAEHPVTVNTAESHRIAPSGLATLEPLALGENAFLAFLQMGAGATVPEHQDATEEYIVILEGGGTLTLDGTPHALVPGSVVYMRPNAKVAYTNGPNPTRAIQVFAGPEPAQKYQAWTPKLKQSDGQ
ncbi:MAG: cupin domain-containing protein [Myxococcota bacterium]|nr:cupin domain-containing protein [Myxococcota bacterium]